MNTIERFRVHAANAPSKIAISESGQALTYGELDRKTDVLASYLALHLPDRKAVIGCVKSSMTTTLLVGLASLKSGHAFTILDHRDSEDRLNRVFHAAECAMVLVDGPAAERSAQGFNLPIHCLAEGLATDLNPQARSIDKDALCYIEPTSGSTGVPKLVPISVATLDHYTGLQSALGDISETDTVALLGEMWFDTILSGLHAGATLMAFDFRRQGALETAEWLCANNVTVVQTFVAAFRAIADACHTDLPALRMVKLAGEVVLQSDVDTFERVCPETALLINYYGSTECSLITSYTHRHGDRRPAGPSLPVGGPVAGTTVKLLTDDGELAPHGSTGRLIVTAEHMSEGYLNAQSQTEGVFWKEPDGRRALDTGDLGQMSHEGVLSIIGRVDDQVKIRGYSVRYSEVEEVVRRLPEISEVAMTSVVTHSGIRQLVCHFSCVKNPPIERAELRTTIAASLPAYMVPSHFIHYDALPQTDTGKVSKRALTNPLDVKPTGINAVAHTHTEATVADVWRDVLGHSLFGREDDFFDIGGDSLQAMSVVIRLERRFPVRIGYESLIMQGASIAEIASRIDSAVVLEDAPGTIVLKDGGDVPPVYVMPVENGEFSDWLYLLNASAPERKFIGVHPRDITQRGHFPRTTMRELGQNMATHIVEQNPTGPYVLAGYSAGTQLATEAARVLQEWGHDVAGLILLDPVITEREPLARTWKLRRILSPAFKRGAVLKSLNRAGHILFGRPAFELDIADETLFWAYQPEPLHGIPVVLGRAIDGKNDADGYLSYWHDVFGWNIEVWDLPGYHNRIARDPFAGPLAARIEGWMRSRFEVAPNTKKEEENSHFSVADPAVAS